MASLGDRIKEARLAAGLRREDVAVALGVGFSTAQRWETGRTAPTIARLREVAALTGQPLSFFLDIEPERPNGVLVDRVRETKARAKTPKAAA